MSKKSKIDVAIAVAEGYLSTDNIIANGESRSCALAVAGLVEVVKLLADEFNDVRHREASTFFESESPEIAAAELNGRIDEARVILRALRELAHDAEPYRDGLFTALRAVDARVAALQAEKGETK